MNEYVAPARDVAFSTLQISKRIVEQNVDGPQDVDADILRHEQMLFGYQANIDLCVHMLKTKREDLEQFEKETALLALAPPATSRERRERLEWQKVVDANKALPLHHRQLVQTAKEKLASLMLEIQEKRDLHRRRRLGDH